jgi:Domain of unknown function (DUF4261)
MKAAIRDGKLIPFVDRAAEKASLGKSQADRSSLLGIVLSNEPTLPTVKELEATILERLPEAKFTSKADPDGVVFGFVGDRLLTVMRIKAPCPIGANDTCVKSAWYWQTAQKDISGHKSHLVVSIAKGSDVRIGAGLLGQCLAAVVDATPQPVAVTVQSSDSLWPAKQFAAAVVKGNRNVALPFFVALKLSRDPSTGGISAMSKGLETFGLMEIETRNFTGAIGDLGGSIIGLAGYLLESGTIVKDGDTVDSNKGEKILVKYERSYFRPDLSVMSLYFPKPSFRVA